MAKIIFILSSVVLFAAVGTPGSNGAVPYLTLSSKYVDDSITITLHDAPQSYELIYYLFNTDDEFIDWTESFGEGGFLLDQEGLVIHKSTDTTVVVKPSSNSCGKVYNVQAVIKETELNPNNSYYTVSRPIGIKLAKKYDMQGFGLDFSGFVPHMGEVVDMTESNGYLYCASPQMKLVKMALASGDAPDWCGISEAGRFAMNPKNILISPNRAVMTDDFNTIGIADISDPGKLPQYIGEFNLPGYAFCNGAVVDMGGKSYALLASLTRGLIVLDVTSLSDFKIVSELLTSENVLSAKRSGNFLFALTASSKAYVYDLSDTPNIQLVAEFSTPSACDRLEFSGSFAYLLSKLGSDLYVYDLPSNISNSSNAQLIQNLPLDGPYTFEGLTAGTNYLYMYSDKSVQSMKIEADGTLTADATHYMNEQVTDVISNQGVLLVSQAKYKRGIETYTLGDFTQLPSPEYNLMHSNVGKVEVLDTQIGGESYRFAYVMDSSYGIRVVDVTDSKNPVLVNTIPDKPLAMTVYKHKLVYATHPKTIKICSIVSEFGDLDVECQIPNFSKAGSLTMRGDDLFIADYFEGMAIYDLSDLANPKLVTQWIDNTNSPKVTHVAVSGYTAFVTSCNGVCSLDISLIAEPKLVQSHSNYGTTCRGTTTDGFNLFVADESNGVVVFDVSTAFLNNGTAFLDLFNSYDYARDISIEGNLACCAFATKYGATISNHIDVYDISDPMAAYCIGSLDHLPGDSTGIEINEGVIYLTDTESLLNIIEVK